MKNHYVLQLDRRDGSGGGGEASSRGDDDNLREHGDKPSSFLQDCSQFPDLRVVKA